MAQKRNCRFICFFLSLVFLIGSATNVAALDSSVQNASENSQYIGDGIGGHSFNPTIIPRVPEVCGGLPYHYMLCTGEGYAYIGTYPDKSNCVIEPVDKAFQCKNCNLVMICQYDPRNHTSIGRYATWVADGRVKAPFTYMWTDRYYTANTNDLSGYFFSYEAQN